MVHTQTGIEHHRTALHCCCSPGRALSHTASPSPTPRFLRSFSPHPPPRAHECFAACRYPTFRSFPSPHGFGWRYDATFLPSFLIRNTTKYVGTDHVHIRYQQKTVGRFTPHQSVQPVIIRYHFRFLDPSYPAVAPSLVALALRLACIYVPCLF